MKFFQNSVWENKILLYVSFLPYVIIFVTSVYCGVVGFRFMDIWCDGFDGFIGSLTLIGLVLISTPRGIPVLLCLIYQIGYLIYFLNKKKSSKA